MRRIGDNDEFIARIAGKPDFELAAIHCLRHRPPFFLCEPVVEPLPTLIVRLRTVAYVSVGSIGRNSASTFAAFTVPEKVRIRRAV
ncbi:hypothetical protein [Mesorhizobium sp. 43Arga]